MSYYPPPNQGQELVAYYPPPGQYDQPAPFPTDQYGPPGVYPPPGEYPPPGQYPPPGPYPPPGQYPPPAQEYHEGPGDWMSVPYSSHNCPPGLEYLIQLSKLFVKQKVEFLELLTGFETKNRYTVMDERGEKIYWVAEESSVCSRMCCGNSRPFEMRVVDDRGTEVLRMNRPYTFTVLCIPCCLERMDVYSAPGTLLGTVQQTRSIFFPRFMIKDADGRTVLKIKGPFCSLTFCGRAEFKVVSRDEKIQVGRISKHWSGFAREMFTDADLFGISFPLDLDVRMKAVMIGAVLLIDAMYFEDSE